VDRKELLSLASQIIRFHHVRTFQLQRPTYSEDPQATPVISSKHITSVDQPTEPLGHENIQRLFHLFTSSGDALENGKQLSSYFTARDSGHDTISISCG
jgi:hypothetical protein